MMGDDKHLRRVVCGEHGPCAEVFALRHMVFEACRRFEQGEELSVLHAEDRVRRDERIREAIIAAAIQTASNSQ